MDNLKSESDSRRQALARKVVDLSIASLYVDMPFLDTALFRLRFEPDEGGGVRAWESDGRCVRYNPAYVLRRYRDSSAAVAFDILHVVLHCVFRHMFVDPDVEQLGWDIACDIAVCTLADSLGLAGVSDGRAAERAAYAGALLDLPGAVTAERVYRAVLDTPMDETDVELLVDAFRVDDHPWYEPGSAGEGGGERARRESPADAQRDEGDAASGTPSDGQVRGQLEQEWADAAKSVQAGLAALPADGAGPQAGSLLQALRSVNRKRYDYKGFLRAFTSWGEQMRVDEDSFDYIYYTFGMDRYGDMPLVEPLEYKELRKLRDVAVCIDTSGSVSGEALQRLFERTYDLIHDEDNAHRRFRIHLIQCDAQVQDDIVVHTRDDLDRALAELTFKGLGGTDFAPAFDYVDELVARGEFVNFKGLIYFTDGKGSYPAKAPAYKAAFVFVEADGYEAADVPAWAVKLVLTEDEVRAL